MAETLERLSIELEARTAIFERRMKESNSLLKKIRGEARGTRGEMRRLGGGIDGLARGFSKLKSGLGALGIAAVGAGFVRSAKQAIEFGDAIAKTATKLGLGAEALQEYRFAGERTGVAQRTVDLALQRFIRRAGEADAGAGELKGTLDALNISTRDSNGQFKGGEALLAEYADAIQAAGSDAERLRLAFKGFDSEGAALVNTLRNGSAGLEGLRQEARDAGVVLDERLLPAMERASDGIGTLTSRFRTWIGTVTGFSLLGFEAAFSDDPIVKLSAKIIFAEERVNQLRKSLEQPVQFDVLTGEEIELTVQTDLLEKAQADLFALRAELNRLDGTQVDIELLPRVSGELSGAELAAEIRRIENEIPGIEIAMSLAAIDDAPASVLGELDKELTALRKRLFDLTTDIELPKAFEFTAGIDLSPVRGLGDAYGATSLEAKKLAEGISSAAAAEAKAATAREKSLSEARKLVSDNRTDVEVYRDEIGELQQKFSEGFLQAAGFSDATALETITREVGKVNAAFVEAQDSAGGLTVFFDAGRTASEVYADRLEEIDEALAAIQSRSGVLSEELLARADRLRSAALESFESATGAEGSVFERLGEQAGTSADLAESAWESAGSSVADSLAQVATSGKLSFGDLTRSILSDISRMITRMLVFQAISKVGSLFGGIGGGTSFTGADVLPQFNALKAFKFAQGGVVDPAPVRFASGGVVTSPETFPMRDGRTGLRGEAGPEAIIPAVASGSGFAVAAEGERGERILVDLGRLTNGDLGIRLPDDRPPSISQRFASGGVVGPVGATPVQRFTSGGVVNTSTTVQHFAAGGVVTPRDAQLVTSPTTSTSVQSTDVFAPSITINVSNTGKQDDQQSGEQASKLSRQIRRELDSFWDAKALDSRRPGGIMNPRLT